MDSPVTISPTGLTDTVGRTRVPLAFPHDETVWGGMTIATAADVDAAVTRAQTAMAGRWGRTSGVERAEMMRRLATLCRRDVEALARLETMQTGKVIRETRAQSLGLARWLDHFAGVAELLAGRVVPTGKPGFLGYTVREPVGVVACLIPWNSPLGILGYKLAPLLAAGCAAVVKPSEFAPATIVRVAELALEAGFPTGVVEVVTGLEDTAKALVAHPGINKISFTGGDTVARAVSHAAADKLIPTTLELGGKSAHVVLADADLDRAANGVAAGIFAAAGQTCVAGSRVVVDQRVHRALVERIIAIARRLAIGNPLDEKSEMGPIANRPHFDRVCAAIERAKAKGVHLAFGGDPLPDIGPLYLRPAIFDDVAPDAQISQEEVFGPVLAITPFDDGDDPVALANGTRYGLAAAIWTENLTEAMQAVQRLKAGMVWVNAYRVVAPSAPFGGVKASGFGRENGLEGMDAFLTTKMVWLATEPQNRDPFMVG